MGLSETLPSSTYRFIEDGLYLDEFIADVVPKEQTIVLVVHHWGSALEFHWERRHADR